MKNIALVPGVLGFEKLAGIINYFNGVAPHLNEKFAGDVRVEPFDTLPLGTVEERAAKLAEQITGRFRGEEVHIFAHSMGGLDARLLVARRETPVAAQVKSITAIGTPHQGSPVATFLNASNPLNGLSRIAELFGHEDSLHPILLRLTSKNALHDLSTEVAATFNQRHPDRLRKEGDYPKVAYHEVVGLSRPGLSHTSVAFEPTFGFLRFLHPRRLENDGVVPVESATRPGRDPIDSWPVDHAEMVGHNLDKGPTGKPEFDYLKAYRQLVEKVVLHPAEPAEEP